MPTELAYLADFDSAYLRRFTARVVGRPPGAIVLDRTYFYPAGGGQPTDRGSIQRSTGEALQITEVRRQGGVVLHRYRGSPEVAGGFVPGTVIEGTIDWDRRYAHMRLHSGQHLLSGLIFARAGRRTVRAELDYPSATIELDAPLSPSEAASLQAELDRITQENRRLRIRRVPRSEWDRERTGRASGIVLPAGVDPVRLIEIDGLDSCPCGGTHVRSAGEIPPAEVRSLSETGDRWVLSLGPPAPSTRPG
ncbi:MAG: alanyl-tRNA editing protein [Thermoplasmata archaeon]